MSASGSKGVIDPARRRKSAAESRARRGEFRRAARRAARVGRIGPRGTAALLAAAGFVVLILVPQIK